MTTSSTDRIEKQITLSAAQSRVWRALSDSTEFGTWFGVQLEGPFSVGEPIHGQITHPGCDHLAFKAVVVSMEPEHTFSFRWQPQATDPAVDYTNEPSTLVEFKLESSGESTCLTVTESGFDDLPESVRSECFFRNEGGWTVQMDSIRKHIDG